MASLELKDPSKVKKISVFEGALDVEASELEITPTESVSNILAGYTGEPEEEEDFGLKFPKEYHAKTLANSSKGISAASSSPRT